MARVIFVEPHPRLASNISANIKLNNWNAACEIIQAVVSDQAGEVQFYEDRKRDGSHSIYPDSDRIQDFHSLGKLPCLTLQDIIQSRKLDKVNFLKIDTEGNDEPVLNGMGHYLQPAFTEILYVEMLSNQKNIYSLLRDKGYVAFAPLPLKRQTLAEYQRRYERGERVAFFRPLEINQPVSGDVLWCGKNSPAAAFLTELNSAQ